MSADGGPDPQQGEAALKAVALSEEQFKFYKDVYASDIKPLATRQFEIGNELAQQNLDLSKLAVEDSKRNRERYLAKFQPVEDGLVDEANNWSKQGRDDQAAMKAGAAIESNYSDAMQQTRRNLARQGISMGSGQLAAIEANAALSKASAKAGVENQARDASEIQGYARRMDAAALGRGVVQNSASQIGLATGAGQASQAALMGAQGAQQQGLQTMGQGFQAAINGQQSAASAFGIMNKQKADQANADNQTTGQVVGTIATVAAYAI